MGPRFRSGGSAARGLGFRCVGWMAVRRVVRVSRVRVSRVVPWCMCMCMWCMCGAWFVCRGSSHGVSVSPQICLNPIPQALHPTPCTLHPTPCTTRHTPPYTLHHTPYTIHSVPDALHPTSHTLNPPLNHPQMPCGTLNSTPCILRPIPYTL